MIKTIFWVNVFLACFCLSLFTVERVSAATIDVLIKGMDDGKKASRDRDYAEAVMNAKLQAIERAGVSIKSMTRVENFQLKYDMVESKAAAVLLPGFQIIDMGYQKDGTYQVVLAGKVQTMELSKAEGSLWGKLRSEPAMYEKFDHARDIWSGASGGDIGNEYVNNEDGTVTDRKTGLMWQKSYQIKENIREVRHQVDLLNRSKFAGYDDWRIPTLTEIGSLVEGKPSGKLNSGRQTYLDAIFDARPYCWYLWSADRLPEAYLLANVGEARGGIAPAGDHYQADGVCVACFKAVRSVK
ncbi:MAG: DUF1566 domain-containing protein [Deltaproteobacteria bacterium]|nr:DUF1566 domain-containing protein [Deltaproteobacteria bacterium]